MPIRHRLSTKMTELCKVRFYFQGWMLHPNEQKNMQEIS